MRGVPGGGRIRENSEARDDKRFCLVDSAIMRLLLRLRRETRDWGEISRAKPVKENKIFDMSLR